MTRDTLPPDTPWAILTMSPDAVPGYRASVRDLGVSADIMDVPLGHANIWS